MALNCLGSVEMWGGQWFQAGSYQPPLLCCRHWEGNHLYHLCFAQPPLYSELTWRSFDVHAEALWRGWWLDNDDLKNSPPVGPSSGTFSQICCFGGASSSYKHTSVLRYPSGRRRQRHIAEQHSAAITCDALITCLPHYGWSDQAAFPRKTQIICFVVSSSEQEKQTYLVAIDDFFILTTGILVFNHSNMKLCCSFQEFLSCLCEMCCEIWMIMKSIPLIMDWIFLSHVLQTEQLWTLSSIFDCSGP